LGALEERRGGAPELKLFLRTLDFGLQQWLPGCVCDSPENQRKESLAGIFNSIPYYGPLLVTAGLALVGFLQFGTVGMTIAVAGVSLLITTLEGSLLTPMLMGRAASMNQVAVFVGLLFWSWVRGVWGMLLAVPMMMAIKVICDHVEPRQPVGHLLGE
jgi:predicted PurR-regulated permease PerM